MQSIKRIIETAIEEDVGPGDITTDNLVDPHRSGKGTIIAKEEIVLAGLDIARLVFSYFDKNIRVSSEYHDGDTIPQGKTAMVIEGSLQAILKGERTALNFLQHLSGIATQVRSYVSTLKNKTVRLTDTRKTIPGLRVLEKYAVRIGGAYNHRMALYDGVLIKDNHIAACGGIKPAVERIRSRISHLSKIEVEVSDLSQVKEALEAKADIIMLDNMNLDQTKAAVKLINKKALVEVSGSVKKETLNALADTGVDIISSGALIHSARFVDLSLRIE